MTGWETFVISKEKSLSKPTRASANLVKFVRKLGGTVQSNTFTYALLGKHHFGAERHAIVIRRVTSSISTMDLRGT